MTTTDRGNTTRSRQQITRECPHCGVESPAMAVPMVSPTEDAENIYERWLGVFKASIDA
jgi:acetone carboxylase gamma subunit